MNETHPARIETYSSSFPPGPSPWDIFVDSWSRNLLRPLRDLQDSGPLEILTCGATHLRSWLGRSPIVVPPCDAELCGHWWFEGPIGAFIMTHWTAVPYAEKRFRDHIHRFTRLYEMLRRQECDVEWLQSVEERDSIFPELNYRIYPSHSPSSRPE